MKKEVSDEEIKEKASKYVVQMYRALERIHNILRGGEAEYTTYERPIEQETRSAIKQVEREYDGNFWTLTERETKCM